MLESAHQLSLHAEGTCFARRFEQHIDADISRHPGSYSSDPSREFKPLGPFLRVLRFKILGGRSNANSSS